jgi:hypothetical protein
MSFKTWATAQDNKQQGSEPSKPIPAMVPAAPKPDQAPAQTTPSDGERKAG